MNYFILVLICKSLFYISIGDTNCTIKKLDIEACTTVSIYQSEIEITALTVAQNGLVALRTNDGAIRIFDIYSKIDYIFQVEGRAHDLHLSQNGEKMVYCLEHNDEVDIWDVWLYNFVENQNSTVYDDGHLNRCPIIESDGKGLLLSTSEGGTTGIYSIGLSEKKKEKILETHGYHHFEPSISPDGTKIIFSSTLDGDFDLWIYHLKEKELEQITRDKGFEGRPCWLSNYKVIYEANHPDHWGIWSIDLRTKEKSLITPKGEKCRYPTIVF